MSPSIDLAVELEPGGQALDDAGQAGAVRLAGGDQLEVGTHGRAPQCMRRSELRRRSYFAGERQTGMPGWCLRPSELEARA